MNTTFHWRAHATELLSREFLEIARQHLNQGGVLYYNTTASPEVQLTGLTVYPHGLRVAQCLAVSDSPIVVDKERWRSVLATYQIDGRPVLNLSDEKDQRRFEEVLGLVDTLSGPDPSKNLAMENGESLRKRIAGARIVTEDNMGTEWLE
jgi:spermidine synthase